nr:immunoglobulin light chain junction region [Macaca mulatta]
DYYCHSADGDYRIF